MCVAIPLKITEIRGSEAVCERKGARRLVRLDFLKNPKPGDYVLVHAGFAIERICESEALETLRLANEVEEALSS